ncbi:MAG: hypothetical protein M3Z26_14885 [Bacteroidota bacterium]|nr:hypothetical protein [Bacteroidota bacterium]
METITIHPKDKEQSDLFEHLANTLKIPFEKNKKEPKQYNEEFVTKIQGSRKNYKEGKGVEINIKELKDLCK